MNKKQETTVSLAIVGMALIATITMISPTQALALGHWNLDEEFTLNMDVAEDGEDSSGTSDNTDEEEEDSSDEEEGDSTTAVATNEDEDEEEESTEDSSNNSNDEDSSSSGYETFQSCLSEIEDSPTEKEVQDCIESSYGGQDNSEDDPSESTDDEDKGETDVTQEYDPRTVS